MKSGYAKIYCSLNLSYNTEVPLLEVYLKIMKIYLYRNLYSFVASNSQNILIAIIKISINW